MVLKPGNETWILASNDNRLSVSPAELRDRFAGIPGAARLYPPEALMSLYVPDRITYQEKTYADALEKHGRRMLLNTDRRPKALLYSLLFAAHEAGARLYLGRFITAFARSGTLVVPLAICLYLLTRLLFRIDGPPASEIGRRGIFDQHAMVAAAGILAMGANLALMFMYQAAFGSIFLHVGLISALFMLGLSLGGISAEYLLARRPGLWRTLLGGGCLCHLLFIALVCPALPNVPRPAFAAAFFVAGLLSGLYVPVAASRSRDLAVGHLLSGSAIEMTDHLGGACGGIVVGLLLIPSFGSTAALYTVALLVAVNALPLLRLPREGETPAGGDRFQRLNRPIGYAMAGVGLFAVISALLLERGQGRDVASAFLESIRTMAGPAELSEPARAAPPAAPLRCFMSGSATDAKAKYFVCSDRSAPDVYGYGGPITVAAMLDGNGAILDLRLLLSDETPAYLRELGPWLDRLKGNRIHELDDVDAMTGATLTSAAVLTALRRTGAAFAGNIMGLDTAPASTPPATAPWPRALLPVLAAAGALLMRRRPGKQLRRLFLLAVVAVLGVVLNFQYSLAHTVSLLGLRLPRLGLDAAFLLVAGVPVLVLLFGNVYCGYLCPFGALQELIGDLRPTNVPTDPDRSVWRYGRSVKYALLFVLIIAFALSRRQETVSCDPLVTAFSRSASGPVGLALLALGFAFLFRRFWCRSLCPAGAFLAALARIRLARRIIPRVAVKLCDLGVESPDDFDCIFCDRCRRRGTQPTPYRDRARRGASTLFLACVVVTAMLLFRTARQVWSQLPDDTHAGRALSSAGRARDVDMRRLRGMIEAMRLSGHEAKYYTRTGEKEARE